MNFSILCLDWNCCRNSNNIFDLQEKITPTAKQPHFSVSHSKYYCFNVNYWAPMWQSAWFQAQQVALSKKIVSQKWFWRHTDFLFLGYFKPIWLDPWIETDSPNSWKHSFYPTISIRTCKDINVIFSVKIFIQSYHLHSFHRVRVFFPSQSKSS